MHGHKPYCVQRLRLWCRCGKLITNFKHKKMEVEEYSPKWLLNEIRNTKSDAVALFKIMEFEKALTKQCTIADVSQQRELLLDFLSKVNGNLMVYPHLQMNTDFIDEYIKSNNCG